MFVQRSDLFYKLAPIFVSEVVVVSSKCTRTSKFSRGMLNQPQQSFAWKMSQNYVLWGTKTWGLLTPTRRWASCQTFDIRDSVLQTVSDCLKWLYSLCPTGTRYLLLTTFFLPGQGNSQTFATRGFGICLAADAMGTHLFLVYDDVLQMRSRSAWHQPEG